MRDLVVVFVSLFAVSLLPISIAVLDFEPRGISEDEAVLITDILRTELLKTGRITIIEREKINALLKERQLSEVGVTESVELGKLLGVDKIIFGRIGKLGDSYIVTARMIDVESGRVDFADQYTCQITTESITKVMKEIAKVVQKYLPPIEGKVALRKGDVVYITLSSKEGVKEGMELAVYRVEQVKDEEGNVIFEDVREIGRVRVLKVSDKGSAARVISESEKIMKGDVVKIASVESSRAPSTTWESKSTKSFVKEFSYIPHYYWIQDKEKVWIKGDWEGEKVLYVYYGATEGDPSERWENGDEVFEFWDDFENKESIKKYTIGSGVWKIENGYLIGYSESRADCGVLDIVLSPKVWSGKDYSVIVKSSLAEVYNKWTGDVVKENLFGTGIAFRVEDVENYWLAKYIYSITQSPYNYELWRKTNGAFESYIDEVVDFGGNGEDIFQVSLYKKNMKLLWNGKEIMSFKGIDINQGSIGFESYCSKFIVDYVIVTKYSPTPPSIEYGRQESGTWQIGGYTFTKRCKVIVRSSKPLKDFQIALDFSKFNDEHLMIVEEKR